MRSAEHVSGNYWRVTDDATGKVDVISMPFNADAAAAVAAMAEIWDGPTPEKVAAEERLGAIIRAEGACRDHIYAVLPETAQKTLMAWLPLMTVPEQAKYAAGMAWIADCRDAFRAFAAGEADDYKFPDPPAGLAEFGRRTRFGA